MRDEIISPYIRIIDSNYKNEPLDSAFYPYRKLLDYQLYYVKQGRVVFKVKGGTYEIKEGGLILIQPLMSYAQQRGTSGIIYMHFDLFYNEHRWETKIPHFGSILTEAQKKTAQPSLDTFCKKEIPLFIYPDNRGEVEKKFNQIKKLYTQMPPLWEIETGHLIFELLEPFIRTPQQGRQTDLELLLQRAHQYLRSSINRKITLKDLAAYVAISSSYLSHAYKNKYGYSPIKHHEYYRIMAAKERILTTDHTLERISFEFGYDNPFNFSRAFKKVIGTSPQYLRSRKHYSGLPSSISPDLPFQ